MCSGSEEGSYLRLIDFLSLNSRLESNKQEEEKGVSSASIRIPCERETFTSRPLLLEKYHLYYYRDTTVTTTERPSLLHRDSAARRFESPASKGVTFIYTPLLLQRYLYYYRETFITT